MKNIYVVLGPSGSGKGTQAALLSKKLDLPSLSMGQILRELDEKQDPLGIEAKKYWSIGKWVPDAITIQSLRQYVLGLNSGFIIDGFPRSPNQPELLDDLAKEIGGEVIMVIHFDISDKTSLARMVKRVKEEELSGKSRADQTPEIMKERLRSYHESIEPVLAYYQKKGILERVDGEPPVEIIAEDIEKRLKERRLF